MTKGVKRRPTGGKRTLPRKLDLGSLDGLLPPAVIGGVPGGYVCHRCGQVVPREEMTAGWQNCRECGHRNHFRAEAQKEQQRATVRREFLRRARWWSTKIAELNELCGEATDLHGDVEQLVSEIYADLAECREKHPGSLRIMQYHMGILRLIAECDRIDAEVREAMQGMTAEELEELEAMTDEEWDEAIREAAGEVFDSIGGSKDHVSGEDAGCRAPFSGS